MRKYLIFTLACMFILTAIDSTFAARRRRTTKTEEEKTATKTETKTKTQKKETNKSKIKIENCMMVADFNSGTAPNNIGAGLGAWDKDPNDETQGCKTDFVSPGSDGKGYCLMLTYDVDSPNPAYNGFWMKLNDLDISGYSKLMFKVKGDKDALYTKKFKVELKNGKEMSPYYVDDISSSWSDIEIPLSYFYRISDWSKMKEFVIVFEDSQATQKTGIIYIDDVSFVK